MWVRFCEDLKMPRGRKPKPIAQRIAEGNPGKRSLNHPGVMLKPALPTAPASLTAVAKIEWTRLAKELFDAGLLTNADRNALANYCEAWADWVDAREKINLPGGKTTTTEKGYEMQSVWVGIANKAAASMHRIAAEFGLTPASRARISIAAPKTPDEEAEERVFGPGE